ncbi:hypothetical protein Taro_025590 [Colocasia esculenta]|uniref:Uncharacterized protein n=1 Tax=Colocasia esculenta TaxID=4460 RepID=A0A843V9R7_COLES|nr:hypothetical protein [Colocasia esculenta]
MRVMVLPGCWNLSTGFPSHGLILARISEPLKMYCCTEVLGSTISTNCPGDGSAAPLHDVSLVLTPVLRLDLNFMPGSNVSAG